MEILVTTPPTAEPVTLADARAFLVVEHDGDDAMLEGLIVAARVMVENHVGRALITQTVKATWNGGEVGERLYIPRPPYLTTTSVKTYDADRTPTTLVSGTDYDVVGTNPAIIAGLTATGTEVRSVEWIGTAGYGAASAVPAPFALAIKMLVAHAYETRGAVTLIPSVKSILAPYRANLV